MLPFGDIATFSAHVILGVGVGQHVLGKVAHVSACEVTQLTLVRFLTSMQKHMPDQHPLVGSGKVALRALVDLFMSMHLAYVVLVGYWVECGKGTEGAPQLFTSWVALLFMFAKQVLIGAGKVTVGTVESIMALVVGFHGFSCGKKHGT